MRCTAHGHKMYSVRTELFEEQARKVGDAATAIGFDVSTNSINNPRKEAEDHYYNANIMG